MLLIDDQQNISHHEMVVYIIQQLDIFLFFTIKSGRINSIFLGIDSKARTLLEIYSLI